MPYTYQEKNNNNNNKILAKLQQYIHLNKRKLKNRKRLYICIVCNKTNKMSIFFFFCYYYLYVMLPSVLCLPSFHKYLYQKPYIYFYLCIYILWNVCSKKVWRIKCFLSLNPQPNYLVFRFNIQQQSKHNNLYYKSVHVRCLLVFHSIFFLFSCFFFIIITIIIFFILFSRVLVFILFVYTCTKLLTCLVFTICSL